MRTFVASAIIFQLPVPLLAQETIELTASEAAVKLNLTSRQRMLSQRMAKAACLIAKDIGFSSNYDQLTQSYTLFTRTEEGLHNGDKDLGLVPETFPEVLAALKAVDEPWGVYRGLIENVIDSGEVSTEALVELDQASLKVLKRLNIMVFKSTKAHAKEVGDVPLSLAITIDVASRQRMLSQKAVKEACLISVAANPEIYVDHLAETTELFDLSLISLRDGYEDVGVMPAPTREIDRKLSEVDELWHPVKEILDRVIEGETLGNHELSILARMSEPLMHLMDEAVHMYGQ